MRKPVRTENTIWISKNPHFGTFVVKYSSRRSQMYNMSIFKEEMTKIKNPEEGN